jgi:hypothetical protein
MAEIAGTSAAANPGVTSVRAFVNALDGALIESSNTRGALGQLITQVNAGSITGSEAEARIQGSCGVRRQRRTRSRRPDGSA